MSYPTEEPVALAVIAAIATGLGANRAGYADKPSGGGAQANGAFKSYAVVYPGSTVLLGGTASDPNADAAQTVQATYIGTTAAAADRARDLGRAGVLAGVTVSGRSQIRPVELADSSIVRRDDEVQPPLWYAVDRYLVTTTPN